jgi:hypothetical protein
MNKNIILGVLFSIISIVLIYLSVRDINLQDVCQAMANIHWLYVALFFFIILFMQWLRSYRWGAILQPMEKIDQVSLFSVTSVGFMAIAAIPARIGELARPYLISRRSRIKMSSALGTVLVERVLDAFSVLLIAMAVLFFTDLPPFMIQSGIIFFLLALLMLCFIVFLILRREKALRLINIILGHLPGKLANKVDELIHHFIDGLKIFVNINSLFYLFFLSMIIWLVDVAAIYTLFLAFGFHLPLMASFVLMIFLIVGIAIPTAPGYIGTWHLACVLALNLFGLPKAEALSFAIVYHFLSMIIVVVLGFAFLPFNKFSISEMKKHINNNSTV